MVNQYPRMGSGLAIYKETAWGEIADKKVTELRGLWSATASPAYAVGHVVEFWAADGRKIVAVAIATPGTDSPADATVGVAGTGTRVWAHHSGVIYPATDLSGMPTYETVVEQGFRGQGSRDLNVLQGGSSGDASFNGWVYPDILGNIFRSMFGEVTSKAASLPAATTFDASAAVSRGDIVRALASSGSFYRVLKDADAGSTLVLATADQFERVPAPTIHTFKRSDTPASSTIFQALADGSTDALQFPGARCSEVGITFNAQSGVLEMSTSWMSEEPETTQFPALFGSADAEGGDIPGPAFMGWQGRVTTDIPDSNAQLESRLIGAEINIQRELEVIHTARNNRSPYSINIDRIGISGNLMVVASKLGAQYDEWKRFAERNLVLEFSSNRSVLPGAVPGASDPFPERTFKIQLSRANLANGPFEIDRSNVGVVFRLPFIALHNLTDEGPGQVIVQSAAYTF